jgi:type II secretory pathway pseudopilin PulG
MNPAPPAKKPGAKPSASPPLPQPAKRVTLNSKNFRLVLLGVLSLSVMLFAVIAILGTSILSSESKKMVALKVKNQTAQAQLDNLEQARKQVDKYSFFKQVAATVIPNDKNQADDIVEINKMADQAGINISSINFPPSTLGGGVTVTPQDATSATSTSKAISQAKPVSGLPGLYSLELDLQPESDTNTPPSKQITYNKMIDFLNRIENNRHTAQITKIEIQPSGAAANSNKGFSFNLSINVFIKP